MEHDLETDIWAEDNLTNSSQECLVEGVTSFLWYQVEQVQFWWKPLHLLDYHAGGCLLALKEAEEVLVSEESQSADNLAATVISEDPHTVLVEFSSVVADTQEYIIEVT